MLLSISIMPCAMDVGVVTVADLVEVSKGSMESPFKEKLVLKKIILSGAVMQTLNARQESMHL